MEIFIIIICVVAVLCSIAAIIYCSKKTIQLDVQRQKYLQHLEEKITDTYSQLNHLQIQKKKFEEENLKAQQENIEKLQQQQKQLQQQHSKKVKDLLEVQTIARTMATHKTKQIIKDLNDQIEEYKKSKSQQKQEIENEINKLKNSLVALLEDEQKSRQEDEKVKFYKLSISDNDLSDVKQLDALKSSFHTPVVLSKLIWSQYFQKQTTDLCNRVLKNKTVCGIYKITNLITKEHYVGQSKNIGERWKAHCKCGLGIEASSTNTLYNNMQKYGIWNFSFEVLQVCPPQQLNEKEQFWIEVYKSNIYGLNTQSGIKKRGTA